MIIYQEGYEPNTRTRALLVTCLELIPENRILRESYVLLDDKGHWLLHARNAVLPRAPGLMADDEVDRATVHTANLLQDWIEHNKLGMRPQQVEIKRRTNFFANPYFCRDHRVYVTQIAAETKSNDLRAVVQAGLDFAERIPA